MREEGGREGEGKGRRRRDAARCEGEGGRGKGRGREGREGGTEEGEREGVVMYVHNLTTIILLSRLQCAKPSCREAVSLSSNKTC